MKNFPFLPVILLLSVIAYSCIKVAEMPDIAQHASAALK